MGYKNYIDYYAPGVGDIYETVITIGSGGDPNIIVVFDDLDDIGNTNVTVEEVDDAEEDAGDVDVDGDAEDIEVADTDYDDYDYGEEDDDYDEEEEDYDLGYYPNFAAEPNDSDKREISAMIWSNRYLYNELPCQCPLEHRWYVMPMRWYRFILDCSSVIQLTISNSNGLIDHVQGRFSTFSVYPYFNIYGEEFAYLRLVLETEEENSTVLSEMMRRLERSGIESRRLRIIDMVAVLGRKVVIEFGDSYDYHPTCLLGNEEDISDSFQ